MTLNDTKEAFSTRFVELIASYSGYKTGISAPDYGTDLMIFEVSQRIENNATRYYETGRILHFQLKATTLNHVYIEDDFLVYDLNIKNYNDMILRKNSISPLFLILFILPSDNKSEWMEISEEELIARRCAYWFIPENAFELEKNKSKKRIKIAKSNVVTTETFTQLFAKVYNDQ